MALIPKTVPIPAATPERRARVEGKTVRRGLANDLRPARAPLPEAGWTWRRVSLDSLTHALEPLGPTLRFHESPQALLEATGIDYSQRVPRGLLGGQSLHMAEKVEIGGKLYAERIFENMMGVDLSKSGVSNRHLGEAELEARAVQSAFSPSLMTTGIHVFRKGKKTVGLERFVPGALADAAAEKAWKKVDPTVKADALVVRLVLGDRDDPLKWNNFLIVPGQGVYSRDYELMGDQPLGRDDVGALVTKAVSDKCNPGLTRTLLRARATALTPLLSGSADALTRRFEKIGVAPKKAKGDAARIRQNATTVSRYLAERG